VPTTIIVGSKSGSRFGASTGCFIPDSAFTMKGMKNMKRQGGIGVIRDPR